MSKPCLARRLAAGALLSAAATSAAADATDPTQVEGIVVTASRTAERLKDVPASVSVISSAEIRDVPAQGLDDTLRLVPGMNLTMMGPDEAHPTVLQRGHARPADDRDPHAGPDGRRAGERSVLRLHPVEPHPARQYRPRRNRPRRRLAAVGQCGDGRRRQCDHPRARQHDAGRRRRRRLLRLLSRQRLRRLSGLGPVGALPEHGLFRHGGLSDDAGVLDQLRDHDPALAGLHADVVQRPERRHARRFRAAKRPDGLCHRQLSRQRSGALDADRRRLPEDLDLFRRAEEDPRRAAPRSLSRLSTTTATSSPTTRTC